MGSEDEDEEKEEEATRGTTKEASGETHGGHLWCWKRRGTTGRRLPGRHGRNAGRHHATKPLAKRQEAPRPEAALLLPTGGRLQHPGLERRVVRVEPDTAG